MPELKSFAQKPLKFFPVRYIIVFGTFLLSGLLYIDRVCISIAKDPLIHDLNLNEKQMGWVLSAFALGYALFQVPSGILIDRYGPRRMLAFVVFVWSLFTTLTGRAWNFISLLMIRFLFGIGESGGFPGVARSSYPWIPMKERGIVIGVNFSGSRIGSALALPLLAWLVHEYGWRECFYLLGAFGALWALLWYWFFRNDPTQHPYISKKETDFILENRQAQSEMREYLPLKKIFGSKNMRWMMLQYFANNFTFFFVMSWLFPYLKEKFNLETVQTGFFVAIPFICGAIGNWIAGLWVDGIYKQGKWIRSRRIPAITGFFLAAVGLLISAYSRNVWAAVIFLSVAIFGEDMTLSSSWSTCSDIGRKNSATVSATMNMMGNLGAFVTSLAFPYLKDWFQSDLPFFYIGAVLNLLAVLSWTRINPTNPL